MVFFSGTSAIAVLSSVLIHSSNMAIGDEPEVISDRFDTTDVVDDLIARLVPQPFDLTSSRETLTIYLVQVLFRPQPLPKTHLGNAI